MKLYMAPGINNVTGIVPLLVWSESELAVPPLSSSSLTAVEFPRTESLMAWELLQTAFARARAWLVLEAISDWSWDLALFWTSRKPKLPTSVPPDPGQPLRESQGRYKKINHPIPQLFPPKIKISGLESGPLCQWPLKCRNLMGVDMEKETCHIRRLYHPLTPPCK